MAQPGTLKQYHQANAAGTLGQALSKKTWCKRLLWSIKEKLSLTVGDDILSSPFFVHRCGKKYAAKAAHIRHMGRMKIKLQEDLSS